MENCDLIREEDWKKAKGVKYKRGMSSNSALTPRDYSKKCNHKYEICVIKGYWIWWCTTHHQPLAWCEKDKIEIELMETKETLSKIRSLFGRSEK